MHAHFSHWKHISARQTPADSLTLQQTHIQHTRHTYSVLSVDLQCAVHALRQEKTVPYQYLLLFLGKVLSSIHTDLRHCNIILSVAPIRHIDMCIFNKQAGSLFLGMSPVQMIKNTPSLSSINRSP